MIDKMMPQNMMQPMTPASENSGIASGMMPQAPAPAPEGVQAMQQMAGQMEQVYRGLDSAEDIEDVINAMRGDDLPLSERYSELAELVGPDDAKKTPESVLTVLQPTFQILQAVPDGGIAEAPMGGVEGSEGNFSQPSATEPSGQAEAVLAMSRGEMPVKAANGLFVNQQNRVANILGQGEGQRTMPMSYAPPLQKIPSIQELAPQITSGVEALSSMLPKRLTLADEIAARQKLLQQYLPKQRTASEYQKLFADALPERDQRTAEQILQERKEFMGTTDADDAEIQTYLALARAGS
jgi:chorismate mutase